MRKVSVINPGVSRTDSTLAFSTGGAPDVNRSSGRPEEEAHDERWDGGKASHKRSQSSYDLEMAHPAKLGEFRLVGMEHVDAGLMVLEGEFRMPRWAWHIITVSIVRWVGSSVVP